MHHSTARVRAGEPQQSVEQVMSHLTRSASTGPADDAFRRIPFPRGMCRLYAGPHHVDLIVSAADTDAETAIQNALTHDLRRRAPQEPVAWLPLVRPAVTGDDAALLALDQTAWTVGSGIPSTQTSAPAVYFTGRRNPESHLVAELGGQPVGYVSVHRKTPFPEAAHVFAIWSLVVAEETRRLGIASALLTAAERKARTEGARKVGLRVLGSNTAAVRLYERHGYRVEGRYTDEFLIDGHYVDDVTLGKTV